MWFLFWPGAQVRIHGGELQVIERRGAARVLRPNAAGRYLHIFEPNPWLEQRRSA